MACVIIKLVLLQREWEEHVFTLITPWQPFISKIGNVLSHALIIVALDKDGVLDNVMC